MGHSIQQNQAMCSRLKVLHKSNAVLQLMFLFRHEGGTGGTSYSIDLCSRDLITKSWRQRSRVAIRENSTVLSRSTRRVFPVNQLHWYWQPYKNNQETEHTN